MMTPDAENLPTEPHLQEERATNNRIDDDDEDQPTLEQRRFDSNGGGGRESLSISDNDNNDDGDSSKFKYSPRIRKCFQTCGYSTGVGVILVIVNGIATLLYFLMGWLLEQLMDGWSSSIEICDSYSCHYDHSLDRRERIELAVYLMCTFIVVIINLGTIFWLCQRYISTEKSYKAARAMFGCSSPRRVYSDAIRPNREVCRILCQSCVARADELTFTALVEYILYGLAVILFWVAVFSIIKFVQPPP